MTKIDLILTGTITNLTPLSIVPPNTEDVAIGDGTTKEVAMMPILRPGRDKPVRLPIIPASTIRGFLRRAAARVAYDACEEKPDLLPYQYSTLGGIKGTEVEGAFNIDNRNLRRERNPIVALFGAAQPWDGSHAMVSNAIPAIDVTPERMTSIRSDDLIRDSDVAERLSNSAIPEYLLKTGATKNTSMLKAKVKAANAAYGKAKRETDPDAIKAAGLELDAAKKAVEDAKIESGTSIQLPLAHSYVMPGVTFEQSIRLMGVYPHEVGLFLAAISEFFEFKSYVGGKGSQDYGLVRASWDVRRRHGRGGWQDVGTIRAEPFEAISLSESLKVYGADWQKYLESGVMNVHVTGLQAA